MFAGGRNKIFRTVETMSMSNIENGETESQMDMALLKHFRDYDIKMP